MRWMLRSRPRPLPRHGLWAVALWTGCASPPGADGVDVANRLAGLDAGAVDAGPAETGVADTGIATDARADLPSVGAPDALLLAARDPDVADAPETYASPTRSPTDWVPDLGVRFERRGIAVFDEHVWHLRSDDRLGYPAGMALVDFDGDLDADVFLGRLNPDEPVPCVFRNDSTPGSVRFTRVEKWCFEWAELDVAGMAVDLDQDGVDELIVTERGGVTLVDTVDAQTVATPLDASVVGSSQTCSASPGVAVDLDLDGALDAIVACQARVALTAPGREQSALVYRGDGRGGLTRWELAEDEPLKLAMNTLAIGVFDAGGDGLPDLAVAVDSFSSPTSANTTRQPGGLLQRCAPDAACVHELVKWSVGPASWGSYMGVGRPFVDGVAAISLSDWGPTRLLVGDVGAWTDLAESRGVALGGPLRRWFFKWSTVVDDFDVDGRDDLLVTAGSVPAFSAAHWASHQDMVLQQGPGGLFYRHATGVGLETHFPPPALAATPALGSRGVLRADLDGDGGMELLFGVADGAPRLFELAGGAPRCSVWVRSAVVPSAGWGVAVSSDGSTFVEHEVQGQFRAMATRVLTPPWSAGWVRFPSGAVAPYACGPEEWLVEVVEPDWLSATVEPDGTLVVSLDGEGAPAGLINAVWLRDSAGASRRVVVATPATAVAVPARLSESAAMIEVDGRLVARWLPIR